MNCNDFSYTVSSENYASLIYSAKDLISVTKVKNFWEEPFFYDLNSSRIGEHQPLFVIISKHEDEFYIEQDILKLWSSNEKLEEAIRDMELQIANLFSELKKTPTEKLGLFPLECLNFLKGIYSL